MRCRLNCSGLTKRVDPPVVHCGDGFGEAHQHDPDIGLRQDRVLSRIVSR